MKILMSALVLMVLWQGTIFSAEKPKLSADGKQVLAYFDEAMTWYEKWGKCFIFLTCKEESFFNYISEKCVERQWMKSRCQSAVHNAYVWEVYRRDQEREEEKKAKSDAAAKRKKLGY